MWPKGYDPMAKGEKPYGPTAPYLPPVPPALPPAPPLPPTRKVLTPRPRMKRPGNSSLSARAAFDV